MQILFVDDDTDDFELFCEAFKAIDDGIQCLHEKDGEAALRFLRRCERLPDYIFLDINMPIMGGPECLKHLKADEQLRDIPVILFSTSCADNEAAQLKKLGASDFIPKPARFSDMISILSRITKY